MSDPKIILRAHWSRGGHEPPYTDSEWKGYGSLSPVENAVAGALTLLRESMSFSHFEVLQDGQVVATVRREGEIASIDDQARERFYRDYPHLREILEAREDAA